jgi:hypothetical protein
LSQTEKAKSVFFSVCVLTTFEITGQALVRIGWIKDGNTTVLFHQRIEYAGGFSRFDDIIFDILPHMQL